MARWEIALHARARIETYLPQNANGFDDIALHARARIETVVGTKLATSA